MKIVILGSGAQASTGAMDNFTTFFENKGCKVIFPSSIDVQAEDDDLPVNQKVCHDSIRKCDLVFLVNPGGQIDKIVSDELEYALSFNKSIYALEKPKGGDFHRISGWLYN